MSLLCRFTAASASAVYIGFGTVKCVPAHVQSSTAFHSACARRRRTSSQQAWASTPGDKFITLLATCRADYGVAMFSVGFLVTLAGQAAAYWLMQRLQRRSVVIFCMAALMCAAQRPRICYVMDRVLGCCLLLRLLWLLSAWPAQTVQ